MIHPWASNLGVILLQLGPLMSYVADGDASPRRQLQMVIRDSGDSHQYNPSYFTSPSLLKEHNCVGPWDLQGTFYRLNPDTQTIVHKSFYIYSISKRCVHNYRVLRHLKVAMLLRCASILPRYPFESCSLAWEPSYKLQHSYLCGAREDSWRQREDEWFETCAQEHCLVHQSIFLLEICSLNEPENKPNNAQDPAPIKEDQLKPHPQSVSPPVRPTENPGDQKYWGTDWKVVKELSCIKKKEAWQKTFFWKGL